MVCWNSRVGITLSIDGWLPHTISTIYFQSMEISYKWHYIDYLKFKGCMLLINQDGYCILSEIIQVYLT